MSNLDSSDHRTLFHFETVYFKWPLAHRTRQRFWNMFTHGFLFAWKSFSWHLQMAQRIVYWQWFLEVFLGPFSNVNDRIMPMSDAVSSEGPKSTGIQQRSSALSLTHRDFTSFSIYLVMLCTVDDEICKAVAIWRWRTLFLKCIPQSFYTLSQIGETLPSFTSEGLCLSKAFLS